MMISRLTSLLPCLFLALLTTACESYVGTTLTLQIGEEAIAAFDAESPGIVMTNIGPAAPLCDPEQAPFETYASDRVISCLGGDEPEVIAVRAWAMPIPADWDAEAYCARPFEPTWTRWGLPLEMNPSGLEPGPGDQVVEGEARLSTRFQGCGGVWLAELVLD